ncbi:MAG TPA: hypothetical protein VJ739_04035 [Gemmataceae bacterium]|nr:hypothetical protein [Gemmataceae bacterium]
MTTDAATRGAMQDDPVALLSHLSADALCARLDELDAERQALMVLLRAARARERALARSRGAAAGVGGE